MSDDRYAAVDRATALREAFDHAFADPPPPDPPPLVDLLAIRVGSEPYALRFSEIAGLLADRKVTPIPSRAPALLGIGGFRGTLVPVYDLHALLGQPASAAARWLAMAAGAPVAFAFATPEGQFRSAREAIVSHQPGDPGRRHVSEFVRAGDLLRPILDFCSLLETVRRQVPATLDPPANPNRPPINPNQKER